MRHFCIISKKHKPNGNQIRLVKETQTAGLCLRLLKRFSVHFLNLGVLRWVCFQHRKDTAALVSFFCRKGRSNILKPMYNMLDVSCAMKTRHSGLLHIFPFWNSIVFSQSFPKPKCQRLNLDCIILICVSTTVIIKARRASDLRQHTRDIWRYTTMLKIAAA